MSAALKVRGIDHVSQTVPCEGLRHLAFAVEDVDQAARRLAAEGVPITLPPTDLPDLGCRVLLFLDPNGVTLEFCRKLESTKESH